MKRYCSVQWALLHLPGVPKAIWGHSPWFAPSLPHHDDVCGSGSPKGFDPFTHDAFSHIHPGVLLNKNRNVSCICFKGRKTGKNTKIWKMGSFLWAYSVKWLWMKYCTSSLWTDARCPPRVSLQEPCASDHDEVLSESQKHCRLPRWIWPPSGQGVSPGRQKPNKHLRGNIF